MDWLTDRPIAHRGLHDETVPENSLAAIRAAIDHGYPIEIDVRMTADGVPIVFHDRTLERLTGVEGAVAAVDWTEIADRTLFDSDERIPKLADALSAIDGQVPVLVELKSRGRTGPLERAVASQLDEYAGRFAIQSFNPLTVAWFRHHRPGWHRGQLSGSFETAEDVGRIQRAVQKRLLTNWYSRPDFIGYEHDRLPYWPVTWRRKRGTPVLAWTVQRREDRRRVHDYADNIIFEGFHP